MFQSLRHFAARIATAAWLVGFLVAGIAPAALADDGPLEPIVVGTPAKIEVYPPAFKLESPRRRMHLIVTATYADGTQQDLTRVAEFSSSNPAAVVIEGGIARPVADGVAEITVVAGGQTAKSAVEVSKQRTPDPVSFNYETLVALSKQGCNSGACHGSPSGKGGFRLSLRAYDPVLDTETLIREVYNRRTNVFEPESSLLLRKPLMEVAHGGGRRIEEGRHQLRGAPQLDRRRLQVEPPDAPKLRQAWKSIRAQRILNRPAHTQQMMVLAHFSDGTVRDVTPLVGLHEFR